MVRKMCVIKWYIDVIEHIIDIDTFWLLVLDVVCRIHPGTECILGYLCLIIYHDCQLTCIIYKK